jgi:4-diphosphocytidyl-2-C-methyl-D-erythritol kinase
MGPCSGEDGMSEAYRGVAGAACLRALAKLTLSLRVLGVRADGYHVLDAEMVNLDLADTVELFPGGDGFEVTYAGIQRGGVPGDGSNLVVRALELLGVRAGVRLTKSVPAGAGLGGGSADAAAVLRWATATGLVTGEQALEMAAKLGSDVPFCVAGGGWARVGGAGEQLVPLPFEEVEGTVYTLLIPPFGVSTAAVYHAWDEMGGPTSGTNHLEPAALRVEPRLAAWRDELASATGQVPTLAGSGSTWWVKGNYPGGGRVVVKVARPR